MPPKKKTELVAVHKANSAALLMEQQNEKARKALELRKAGHTWWHIAENLGVTETAASNLVSHAIAEAAAMVDEGAKRALLALEIERLDELQRAVWTDATSGDIRAVEAALKIIQARSKVLGLDNITGNTVTNNTIVVAGTSEQYVDALRKIAYRSHLAEGETDGSA